MNKNNSLTADLGENLKNAIVHTLEKDLKNVSFSSEGVNNFSSENYPKESVTPPRIFLHSSNISQKNSIIPSENASLSKGASIFKETSLKEIPIKKTFKDVSNSKPELSLPLPLLPSSSRKIPRFTPIVNKPNLSENYSQKNRTIVSNLTPSPFLNKIDRIKSNNVSNVEKEEARGIKGSAIEIEKQKSIPIHSEKRTVLPNILEKYRIPKILPQSQQENKHLQENIPPNKKEDNKVTVKKDGRLLIENIHSFGYILKRCFKIAFSIFIFSVFGFLSIYFWVTKASIESVLEKFIPQDFKAESVVPKREGERLPNFSLDSANYFSFDINNLEKEGIKEVISKKTKDVLRSKASSPIEFALTDKQNNPISFEFFSRKIGASLLIEEAGNYIGSDFSLFMQNEEGNIKICLVVALKNNSDMELKSKLLSLENRLLSEMDFIYLDYEKDFENNKFNSSGYDGYDIRYINANSDKKLSLDYTVYKNYLVLGSSSLVEHSVLDLLFHPKNEVK